MKSHIISILTFVFIFLFVHPSDVGAQTQKIGYFDSEVILSKIPEYAGLDQQLKIFADRWRAKLKVLDDEILALEKDFEAKQILFTEELKTRKKNEINLKKKERDVFLEQKFGPEGEYFKQQQTLLEPIQRRVFLAVKEVATRGGYDFIFDRSNDVRLVYARDEWNITNAILIELGIDPDAVLRN